MPYVGEIVIYHEMGYERAAVVTHVHSEEMVNLYRFEDGSHEYGVEAFEPCRTSVMKGDQYFQWSPIGVSVLGETLEVKEGPDA